MLDPHRASRRRSQRGVLTATSLDAGFLVGAENELGGPQGPTVPASLVQVENATCFFGELRVAGKDPTAMSPRAEGVGAEPPPQGAAADFAYDALRDNLTLDFGEGQPGQRQSRSEEHTSELQSQSNLVCRLLLEKKKTTSESRVVATLTSIFT